MSFITDILARIRGGAFTRPRSKLRRIPTPRPIAGPDFNKTKVNRIATPRPVGHPDYKLRTPRGNAKQQRRKVNRENRARKAHTCGTRKGRIKLFY